MANMAMDLGSERSTIVEKLAKEIELRKARGLARQPRYVLPYDPKEELGARELVRAMCEQDFAARGLKAIVVDLYELVLRFLDEEGIWDEIVWGEGETDRDELILILQDTLSIEDVIAPAVEERIAEEEPDIAFLVGVGATFPYLHTHRLVNEALATNVPVVLAFPGSFLEDRDGAKTLSLFGLSLGRSGEGYRATNVFNL